MYNKERKQQFLSDLSDFGYKGTWMYQQLDFLLNDPDNYKDFVEKFWDGDLDRLFLTVSRFRKYILEKKKMSLHQFAKMFKTDEVKALEELFQHRVPAHMLELLQKRKLSVEQVYQFTEKNQGRGLSLLNLIL